METTRSRGGNPRREGSGIAIPQGLVRALGSQWLAVGHGAFVVVLLMVFIARQLAPARLADYVYLLSVAELFAIAQGLGLAPLIFREQVAPTRALGVTVGRLIGGYLGWVLAATALGSLALPWLLGGPALAVALALGAARCATGLVSAVLKGAGRFPAEAGWKIALRTASGLGVVGCALLLPGLPAGIFAGYLVGELFLLATPTARAALRAPVFALPPRAVLRSGLAMITIHAATTVYFRCDIVMLRSFGAEPVLLGGYGLASQLLGGVVMFAAPAMAIAFRFLRLRWRQPALFRRHLTRILVGAVAAGLVLAAGGAAFAPRAVRIAFGPAYDHGGSLFAWLGLALVFLLPNFAFAQALLALNRERIYAVAAAAAAVFNIGLNLYLLPRFGTFGAVASTVATEALLCALLGLALRALWTDRGGAGGREEDERSERQGHEDTRVEEAVGPEGQQQAQADRQLRGRRPEPPPTP